MTLPAGFGSAALGVLDWHHYPRRVRLCCLDLQSCILCVCVCVCVCVRECVTPPATGKYFTL